MAITAELILQELPYLFIEDIKRATRGIMSGRYGKFYEGIDGIKLLEMFKKYDLEREEEIINYRKKQSSEQKDYVKGPILPDKILEVWKGKGKDEEVKKATNDRMIALASKYYSEFDIIYSEQGEIIDGIRMIDYNGNKIDAQEYIKIKIQKHENYKG